mgnify:CR=1 FL=1
MDRQTAEWFEYADAYGHDVKPLTLAEMVGGHNIKPVVRAVDADAVALVAYLARVSPDLEAEQEKAGGMPQ